MLKLNYGDCLIQGHSLVRELSAIRRTIGICTQKDILFPLLTVREHLLLLGRIKGLPEEDLEEEAARVTAEVDLADKADVLSKSLSGGMKRKLCLGLALIGDPKFVMLDEVTSGLDPYSRRNIWEILRRYKRGRAVLYTTHYLDEAEIVSDRIGILADGVLRCSGSSLFLKTRFDAGYVLTMSVSEKYQAENVNEVLSRVRELVLDASLLSVYAREVVFTLPQHNSPNLSALFAFLQEHSDDLGIDSFGVSMTSLQHVFLLLASTTQELRVLKFKSDSKMWALLSHIPSPTLSWMPQLVTSNFRPTQSRRVAENSIFSSPYKTDDKVEDPQPRILQSRLERPIRAVSVLAIVKEEGPEEGEVDELDIDTPRPSETSYAHNRRVGSVAVIKHHRLSWSPDALSASIKVETVKVFTAVSVFIFWLLELNLYSIQFIELTRKQVIMASRDRIGLFFQVAFPFLQILLIFAILLINLNPTPRTLRLLASSFPFTAHVTVQNSIPTLEQSLRINLYSGMQIEALPAKADPYSSTTTSYLENDTPFIDRLASYVFDDLIKVELTVDTAWVLVNYPAILANFGFLYDNFFVVDTQLLTITEQQVRRLSSTDKDLTDTNTNNGLIQSSIEAHRGLQTIINITVPSNATITQIINLLPPAATVVISFYVQSPYTVMHNSSSPHGLAIFNSELRSSFFESCATGGTQATDRRYKQCTLCLLLLSYIKNDTYILLCIQIYCKESPAASSRLADRDITSLFDLYYCTVHIGMYRSLCI